MKDSNANSSAKLDSSFLIRILVVLVVIVLGVVVFSLIYYNFFFKKSYSEIEGIMADAAKQYYSEHKKGLPKIPGDTTEVKVSTLVAGDYMKSISDYVKDEDVACKAVVRVTNVNNNYRYNPLLDCGRYHSYEMMIDHLKTKVKVVTEKDGLYQIGDDLVYRGEKINNHVKFAGQSWRIIKISNDKMILIYDDKLEKTVWDDRYNKNRDNSVGINDYSVSRIKDYLAKLYRGSKLIKSDSDKLLLSNFNLDIGKVGEDDDDHKGDLVRSSTISNQYIGMLNLSEFMNASLDKECASASSQSCSNYNYLAESEYNYWTITGDKNTTHKVFKFIADEGTSLSNANSPTYVRPVVAIVKDAVFVSGNGSLKKPYVFR
ncbi:MAG: hypothetical protein VZS44_01535 [Bacilli bacterium]|nr:hypothetical protein [Bacilli bacterium]